MRNILVEMRTLLEATKQRRPSVRTGDRVKLADHVRSVPAYDGKPAILKDTVLRVSSVSGKGSLSNPFRLSVKDDSGNFWHLDPDDVISLD